MCLQLSVTNTVYSSTFGGVALMSAEKSTSSGDLPANSKSKSGPRTTLHIPSASATIPVHADLRRMSVATCATPKPRMHSYRSPAEEREEAEMPPPPALHEEQGEEQRYR